MEMPTDTPSTKSRLEIVNDRFLYICQSGGLEPIGYGSEDWLREAPASDDTLHRPFGYLPTADMETLHFAPEVIVAQTAGLGDAEFMAYVDVVEIHVCKHIKYFGEENAEYLVDNEIYELAPGSQTVLSEVSMSALDAK